MEAQWNSVRIAYFHANPNTQLILSMWSEVQTLPLGHAQKSDCLTGLHIILRV